MTGIYYWRGPNVPKGISSSVYLLQTERAQVLNVKVNKESLDTLRKHGAVKVVQGCNTRYIKLIYPSAPNAYEVKFIGAEYARILNLFKGKKFERDAEVTEVI